MGRGRQKAKQTKVARELKYFSPEPDYRVLERELNGHRSDVATERRKDSDDGDDYPRWGDDR